jgi:hypothetical protein
MDVVIGELHSTVELGAEEALLDPAVVRVLVAAVRRELDDRDAARRWDARERSAEGGHR